MVQAWIIPGLRGKSKIKHQLPVKKIIQYGCQYFVVSVDEILSKKRTRSIGEPRMLIIHYLSMEYGMGCALLAREFNKNHASIIHARKTAEDLMITNRNLRDQYHEMAEFIESKK